MHKGLVTESIRKLIPSFTPNRKKTCFVCWAVACTLKTFSDSCSENVKMRKENIFLICLESTLSCFGRHSIHCSIVLLLKNKDPQILISKDFQLHIICSNKVYAQFLSAIIKKSLN